MVERIDVDWFLSVMADKVSMRSGFLILEFGADLAGVWEVEGVGGDGSVG